jgi:hypothetical protein
MAPNEEFLAAKNFFTITMSIAIYLHFYLNFS